MEQHKNEISRSRSTCERKTKVSFDKTEEGGTLGSSRSLCVNYTQVYLKTE